MYYPQDPKEPSGCVQTIIITRMMLGILLVPVLAIAAVVVGVLLVFYALSVHPLLALGVVAGVTGLLGVAIRWEMKRVAKETPSDEG